LDQHAVFLLLGLANGGVFAALALALVVTYRSSGVLNFATGAVALLSAYIYSFLRQGELILVVPGLPRSVSLGGPVPFAAAVGLTLGLVGWTATFAMANASTPDQLAALKKATDRFHSIAVAEQSGYGLLTDAAGIACIDMPGMGGMGVHWANGTLVGDPAIWKNHPEALVYAPGPDGTLTLAAVEYVVLKSAWDATHTYPPKLFGHVFNLTTAPNRYGLPDFYSLHVWVWKHNRAGTFAPWNPAVTCPS